MKKIILGIVLFGSVVSYAQTSSNININEEIETKEVIITQNTDNSKTKSMQQEVWLESLITDTPQEGRELAIKMARKTIGAIQSDPEVKKRLRKEYAEDSEQLILSAQVVATEFQTIAAANNYWRK